jgi:hypothetical protein
MALQIFQRTIVDQQGSVVNGASVTVRSEATGALAPIYTTRAGDVLKTNPIVTGVDGFVEFYAPAGEYRVDAVFGGDSIVWRYVKLLEIDQDANGNVGIGGISPTQKLDVNGSIRMRGDSARLIHTRTSGATVIEFGIGVLTGFGDCIGLNNQTATGFMSFGTNNTERVRIDLSGNLLVGYTSSNGAYKLQVNSQIFATSSTIATSDGRYKEEVKPLTGMLETVCLLRPVSFKWKEHPVHAFDRSAPTVGFIAQEVQEVLADKPYLQSIVKRNECVIEPETKDGEGNVTQKAVTEEFYGIAEGNLIALLTAAIQEQQAIIESLTARIEALEGQT